MAKSKKTAVEVPAAEAPAVEAPATETAKRSVAVATSTVNHGRAPGVRFLLKAGDALEDAVSYGHEYGKQGVGLTADEIASLVKRGLAELREV